MNLALWIVAGLLAAAYFVGGWVKMIMPRDKFASLSSNSKWAEEFTPGTFKVIGVVEALGAVGLILPAVFDIAPILVPIAASGLALYMSGAATTWLRRAALVAEPEARAGTGTAGPVTGVREFAPAERQATAADAAGQSRPQPL